MELYSLRGAGGTWPQTSHQALLFLLLTFPLLESPLSSLTLPPEPPLFSLPFLLIPPDEPSLTF